jgi:hypothetical protein
MALSFDVLRMLSRTDSRREELHRTLRRINLASSHREIPWFTPPVILH